jgi:hypothetical protein
MKSQKKNYSRKNKNTKRHIRRNARSKTRKMRGGVDAEELIKLQNLDDPEYLINLYLNGEPGLPNNLNLSGKLIGNKINDDENNITSLVKILVNNANQNNNKEKNTEKKKSIKIITLDVSHNNFNTKDLQSFSHALILNPPLKNLDISGNKITITGAEALAKALKVNTKLEILDLGKSNITDNAKKILQGITDSNCKIIIDGTPITYNTNNRITNIKYKTPPFYNIASEGKHYVGPHYNIATENNNTSEQQTEASIKRLQQFS